ncbi:MAG: multidrug transporter [Gammaproteobacteria bacterium]|nr:multidrug transporter [Gammaproteobacteria bacterium]MDX2462623.1 multidrug transporter [Gammaproteobacteria bacterium]
MNVTGKTTLIRFFAVALTTVALHLPGVAQAAGTGAEPELRPPQGSSQDMIGDLVLQRPFGLATTVVGIGTWIVALPFTIFSGSAGNAGEVLVAEPGLHTFARPLGYPAPVSPDR